MSTKHKTAFSVNKKDVVLVKPAEAKPLASDQLLSLSTMDNNHHLEFHCQTIHVYEANTHATTDPVSVLKEALSRVLVYYYPLAGKVKRYKDGKIRITCDPEDHDSFGVPFLEATADCELLNLGYFEEAVDANDVRSFFFEYSPTKGADVDGYYHPLVMQVTKFACGGFTFAMGLLHSVCDGFAAVQFFQALGELASTGDSELSVKPVWERERWLQGTASDQLEPSMIFDPAEDINPPFASTSPFLPRSSTRDHDDMVHEWFNIEAEEINKLKTLCLPQKHGQYDHLVISEPARPSTLTSFEILGSFVWRARFRALEQNLVNGKADLVLIMGVKHLLKPPLPQGYYGNAIVASHAGSLTGKELVEGSVHDVAKVIKECKKLGSNGDYVKGSLDILETMIQRNVSLPICGAMTVLTDWRQLGWCEVADFGWRKPVNMIALPWSMIGHNDDCVILTHNYRRRGTSSATTTEGGGGARILLSLPRDAMPRFKEEMDALRS